MKTRIVFSFFLLFCAVQLSAAGHWFEQSFSENLVYKNGKVISAEKVLSGKTVAVYFSASWCGPCRLFTPKLVDFYNSCAGKKNVEIVFASSDRTLNAMQQYMQKANMPWPAIPFDAQKLAQLRRKLRVNGIPRLIVFDPNGKIISDNARWDVTLLGADAADAWKKADYKPLTYQDYREKISSGNNRNSNTSANRHTDSSQWKKGPSPQWHISMDTAFAAAKRTNKKIFILTTGSDWCSWCNRLYKEVLDSKTFKTFASRNLILVYLDYPHGKQPEEQKLYNELIVKPLRIYKGAPAAFILTPDGRLIGSISGYSPLKKYMNRISNVLRSVPNRKTPRPPKWLKYPPAKLAPLLNNLKKTKSANARKAHIETEKIKSKMKFQVVAWGWSETEVNNHFSPGHVIKVPLEKRIYFKVRYQLPPGVNCRIWLRADSSYLGSPFHSGKGKGEFTAVLAARRPATEKQLKIRIALSLPESKDTLAAALPCNIIWGNN